MPVTVTCDYCKQKWEVPDDPKERKLHGCVQQSAMISAVIGNVAHFMPIKQATKELGAVSKSFQKGLESDLAPAKTMWALNNAFGQTSKQNKSNFLNEGVAARLLKAISKDYEPWDTLATEKKDQLKVKFESQEYTPDYFFKIGDVERVGDAFSVNCSQGPPGEEARRNFDFAKAAKSAITTSFPSKVTEKWRKYGNGSVAVANLSAFPDEATVATSSIIELIGQLCVKEFATYSKKDNLLFLIRDPLIKQIILA